MTDSDLERTKRQKDSAFEEEARRLAYESREHARREYYSDIKETKIDIARKLVAKGLSTEDICDVTGLSHETVEQFRDS